MPRRYSKKDALSFLKSVSIMSIAVNLNKRPISSVVVFYVDNDFSFFFAAKRSSYKTKALTKNPFISLSVWRNNEMLVQAHGKTRETADQKEYDTAMKEIIKVTESLNHFRWPLLNLSMKGSENVVYKVETQWLRILDLREDSSRNESPFTNII